MTAPQGPAQRGRIFHVTSRSRAARTDIGLTDAAPLAVDQFERHGFVHCCFREQLAEIVTWWFDPVDDLAVVELDPTLLVSEVRLEPSPSRWYPHCYGPLDAGAVVAIHHLGPAGALPSGPLVDPPPGFQLVGRRAEAEVAVQWRAGRIAGDAPWCEAAQHAIDEGQTIELIGGIKAPATLAAAYEAYLVLASLGVDVVRYDGDGFFSSLA